MMGTLPDDPLRSATVLLVDDEADIRRSLRRLFERRGVPPEQVLEAASGEEALVLLAQRPVDVALCDYRMKGLTGVDVLSWVAERQPGTAKVLLTGYADLQMAVEAIQDGRVGAFLQKPWDNEDLLERVRALLRDASRAPPGR
jgi:DNA-binding NtrC family response regulator